MCSPILVDTRYHDTIVIKTCYVYPAKIEGQEKNMRYYSIPETRTIRTQCKNSTAGSSNMISVKVKDYCSVIAICLVVFFSSASASNSSCPAWFYINNSTQDCERGRWLDCSNDNKVLIENGYCATSSGQGDQYYIGYCPFGHPVNRTNRMYSEMPSDPNMLDDVMCGPYKRKGLLCGECIDGYGPPVYSFDMKCVNCSKLSPGYAVALYLVLELLPITLFFICLIVFRFNITAGPLLGHIIFCQLYIESFKENVFIYEYMQSHVSPSIKALFKFSLTLSQFWNFDYLNTVIPPFCISEKLTNIEVKMLDFVPATYPIVLVIITCILMELHARNCRMVHILWKPFGIILNKTNTTTGVTIDAVIHAFASFILLSNVKVLITTAAIQVSTKISSYNRLYKKVLLYQPNMEFFGTRHIIYISIAAVPCIMVTIIPSLVLTIYPTRIYRCLSHYLSARKRLALTAFAEALNSHLKDGLNGTRDYRWCAGFSLFGIVLYELIRNFLESILLFNPCNFGSFYRDVFCCTNFLCTALQDGYCKSLTQFSFPAHRILWYSGTRVVVRSEHRRLKAGAVNCYSATYLPCPDVDMGWVYAHLLC